MSVEAIQSKSAFDAALEAAGPNTPVVVFFWEEWHAPSKALLELFGQLAKDTPTARFVTVRAEAVMEVTERFPVQSVPTFVFLRAGRVLKVLANISGPADLTNTVREVVSGDASAASEATQPLQARLAALVRKEPVMLFMKGNPAQPRCKFSRQMVDLLAAQGVSYGHFDILEDNDVRQGLKTFSDFPTFPQFYINGSLVGGLDIVKELSENGELKTMLPSPSAAGGAAAAAGSEAATDLNARLKQLTTQQRIMLFMKGTPSAPRCGFSQAIVQLLGRHNAKYGSFDVLSDNAVRQGLKKYSDWQTYPQLYIDGELIGGIDVVREMDQEGDLAPALKAGSS